MDKKLTIVITTYNRRNRLINQLRSVFKQNSFINVEIVICDNCSDYNLKEALNDEFSAHELSVVNINRRPFNIGMVGNLSHAFLEPKTKWMWLLSDDDETSPNAIEKIFECIENHSEALVLKFTEIDDLSNIKYGVKEINNIDTLFDFCTEKQIRLGDFIYMSNNIYNMEMLNPYLGSAFVHSYTYFPHIIPILTALDAHQPIKFLSDCIVKYKLPEVPASSNYFVSIYLGAMTIVDIPLHLSKPTFSRLIKYFHMNFFWIISNHFFQSNYLQKRMLYKKVYYGFYNHKWSLKNWMIYHLFSLQMYINSNTISSFCERMKFGNQKKY